MTEALSIVGTLVGVVSVWIVYSRWRESRRKDARDEIQALRRVWEDELSPPLVGRGGVLTNQQFGVLAQLRRDARLVSTKLERALREVNSSAADLTAMEAVDPTTDERRRSANDRLAEWRTCQEAMKSVDAQFDRLLGLGL